MKQIKTGKVRVVCGITANQAVCRCGQTWWSTRPWDVKCPDCQRSNPKGKPPAYSNNAIYRAEFQYNG